MLFCKKAGVRIRNSVDDKIEIFLGDPTDPGLDNHELEREWKGLRSIDITSDWRAIYEYKQSLFSRRFENKQVGEEIVAYFVAPGTHKELYEK